MSTIHKHYTILTGLEEPNEDGQEMEASSMNSNKVAPMESQCTWGEAKQHHD